MLISFYISNIFIANLSISVSESFYTASLSLFRTTCFLQFCLFFLISAFYLWPVEVFFFLTTFPLFLPGGASSFFSYLSKYLLHLREMTHRVFTSCHYEGRKQTYLSPAFSAAAYFPVTSSHVCCLTFSFPFYFDAWALVPFIQPMAAILSSLFLALFQCCCLIGSWIALKTGEGHEGRRRKHRCFTCFSSLSLAFWNASSSVENTDFYTLPLSRSFWKIMSKKEYGFL